MHNALSSLGAIIYIRVHIHIYIDIYMFVCAYIYVGCMYVCEHGHSNTPAEVRGEALGSVLDFHPVRGGLRQD